MDYQKYGDGTTPEEAMRQLEAQQREMGELSGYIDTQLGKMNGVFFGQLNARDTLETDEIKMLEKRFRAKEIDKETYKKLLSAAIQRNMMQSIENGGKQIEAIFGETRNHFQNLFKTDKNPR